MERLHLIISGNVTGVLFRSYTRAEAEKLGLTGWVRNISDKVEIVAEGPREKLEEMIKWSKVGPSSAEVAKVEVDWEKASGEFSNFQIVR